MRNSNLRALHIPTINQAPGRRNQRENENRDDPMNIADEQDPPVEPAQEAEGPAPEEQAPAGPAEAVAPRMVEPTLLAPGEGRDARVMVHDSWTYPFGYGGPFSIGRHTNDQWWPLRPLAKT